MLPIQPSALLVSLLTGATQTVEFPAPAQPPVSDILIEIRSRFNKLELAADLILAAIADMHDHVAGGTR
jgi:hypothetical protein